MIEHIMQLIMNLCNRLVCLQFGTKIAEGPTPQVANDPQVTKACLGKTAVSFRRCLNDHFGCREKIIALQGWCRYYRFMPTIEYKCPHCGHTFNRTILKGDEPGSKTCPECHHGKVKPSTQYPGLFEGIANFSTLAKDTN